MAATGCQNKVEASGPQVATVARRDVTEQILLGGQVVVPPPARADVAAPFTSSVERVEHSVGQRVDRGDVLVQLAVPTAQAYAQQAQARLANAQSELRQAQKQYDQQVSQARQRLKDAQQALQQAQQASASPGGSDTGTGAASETPDAGAGPGGTGANGPSTGAAVQQAQQQVQEAQRALDQAKTQEAQALRPYRERLSDAQRATSQARVTADQGLVRAPISGTIVALNAQPGQQVAVDPNAPVATIIDLRALQVQAPMGADQATRVKQGMDVSLTFDELAGKTFPGTVKQITTTPNGGYVAVVTFTNTDRQVQPTYHPHVGVLTGRSVRNALAVPASAVALRNNAWVCYIQQNGRWVPVQVAPGMSDGMFTTIVSGLQEGQGVEVPAKG